jgi:hypothetical protein
MADRRSLRHVSVVVGALVVAAGMSSCTQSMPVPAKTSTTPTSSGTSASSSASTTTTTTASTAESSTDATTTTASSTDSSATTSTSTSTSSTSSSTPTTTTTTTAASGAGALAPKVVVGDSVLTAEGPVQCANDSSNGTRTIQVGSGTVYTAQVTSDEDFSVVKVDLGVVDGVPMQFRANGGSVAPQGRRSANSYSIVGTAQGTDPSTKQLVKKDFMFEATCP